MLMCQLSLLPHIVPQFLLLVGPQAVVSAFLEVEANRVELWWLM